MSKLPTIKSRMLKVTKASLEALNKLENSEGEDFVNHAFTLNKGYNLINRLLRQAEKLNHKYQNQTREQSIDYEICVKYGRKTLDKINEKTGLSDAERDLSDITYEELPTPFNPTKHPFSLDEKQRINPENN